MAKALSELTLDELWQLFPIILKPYNIDYPQIFQRQQKLIIDQLGKANIFRLNHIGSSAVVGLPAKPTIDLLLELQEDFCPENVVAALEPIGFSYEGNPTIKSGEMLFYKGYTPDGFAAEVFHLHLRNPGDWDELYFRDYLRLHPEIADEYAVLKAELAVKYKFDRDAYTLAKGDFIRRQTTAARIEFPGRYQP